MISLLPLGPEHAGLLQAVYRAVPAYWAAYDLPGAPPGQAERDLGEAGATPGRTILGMIRPLDAPPGEAGQGPRAEMVGALDVRLHYPDEGVASVGMIMVAEPLQRQGFGRAAWGLFEPWLAGEGGMERARAAVAQFNTQAVHFFGALGFAMTGEARRIQVGDKFVRLLTMQKELRAPQDAGRVEPPGGA